MTLSNGLLLITGATGLAGSQVAAEAVKRGLRVRALVRSGSWNRRFLEDLGVELVPGDLTDRLSIERAARGVDYIVHSAPMIGEGDDIGLFRRIQIDGLTHLLDAALKEPRLRRFVALSSLHVYASRDHFGTDENVPVYISGSNQFARARTEAELIIREYMRLRSVPAVIMRPGLLYGPRDRHLLPSILAQLKAGTFAYVGDGQRCLDNTGSRNLAHAVMLSLDAESAIGETFNITDEQLITRVELIETLCNLIGVSPPKISLPQPIAKPLVLGLERLARGWGRGKTPPLAMSRFKFLTQNRQFSIEKAKRILGYRSVTPVSEGLAESVVWYERGSGDGAGREGIAS